MPQSLGGFADKSVVVPVIARRMVDFPAVRIYRSHHRGALLIHLVETDRDVASTRSARIEALGRGRVVAFLEPVLPNEKRMLGRNAGDTDSWRFPFTFS